MVLDEAAVDPLGLLQLAQLEQRKPQHVARPLVARLVPQRLLQQVARALRVAPLQRLGPGGQRAVEFLVLGEVRVVVEEPALLQRALGGIDHGALRAPVGSGADEAILGAFAARFSS